MSTAIPWKIKGLRFFSVGKRLANKEKALVNILSVESAVIPVWYIWLNFVCYLSLWGHLIFHSKYSSLVILPVASSCFFFIHSDKNHPSKNNWNRHRYAFRLYSLYRSLHIGVCHYAHPIQTIDIVNYEMNYILRLRCDK